MFSAASSRVRCTDLISSSRLFRHSSCSFFSTRSRSCSRTRKARISLSLRCVSRIILPKACSTFSLISANARPMTCRWWFFSAVNRSKYCAHWAVSWISFSWPSCYTSGPPCDALKKAVSLVGCSWVEADVPLVLVCRCSSALWTSGIRLGCFRARSICWTLIAASLIIYFKSEPIAKEGR